MLQHNLGDIKFCTSKELLTLGDLLSRLKQTMYAFQEVTGRDPKWFLTTVTVYPPETHFLLFAKPPDEVMRLVDGRSVTVQPMPKGSSVPMEPRLFSLVGSLIPICPAFTPPIGGFGLRNRCWQAAMRRGQGPVPLVRSIRGSHFLQKVPLPNCIFLPL